MEEESEVERAALEEASRSRGRGRRPAQAASRGPADFTRGCGTSLFLALTDYVRDYAGFRLPGTHLLPMNMGRPLLAGASKVVAQPTQWVEHLLGAAGKPAQGRGWACLHGLSNPSCHGPA
jgi:hypothetical protein